MIMIRSSLPSKTNIRVRGKSGEKRTTAVRVCELYQTTPANPPPRANKGKDQLVLPGINLLRNAVWASARLSVSLRIPAVPLSLPCAVRSRLRAFTWEVETLILALPR